MPEKITTETEKYELSLSGTKHIILFVTGKWNQSDMEFFYKWLGFLHLSDPENRKARFVHRWTKKKLHRNT
jgi:hypothetical protein